MGDVDRERPAPTRAAFADRVRRAQDQLSALIHTLDDIDFHGHNVGFERDEIEKLDRSLRLCRARADELRALLG